MMRNLIKPVNLNQISSRKRSEANNNLLSNEEAKNSKIYSISSSSFLYLIWSYIIDRLVKVKNNGSINWPKKLSIRKDLNKELDNPNIWSCPEYKDLPQWLRINDFIPVNHRPQLPSIAQCLKSIFRLHYDTLNIWTHLLGQILPIYVMFKFFQSPGFFQDSLLEQLVLALSIFGPFISAYFSTVYHIFTCHSFEAQCFTVKLDYLGVISNFYFQNISIIYFTNYCNLNLMIFLISLITILFILATICVLSPFFNVNSSQGAIIRLIIFTIYGLSTISSGLIPYLTHGYWHMIEVLLFHFLSYSIYSIAVISMWMKFPERFLPNRWKYLFHSHALMHLCAIGGSYAAYLASFYTALHQMRVSKHLC